MDDRIDKSNEAPHQKDNRSISDYKAEAYFVGQIVCGMKFDSSE